MLDTMCEECAGYVQEYSACSSRNAEGLVGGNCASAAVVIVEDRAACGLNDAPCRCKRPQRKTCRVQRRLGVHREL